MKNYKKYQKWQVIADSTAGKAGKIADKIATAYLLLNSAEKNDTLGRYEINFCRALDIPYKPRLGDWNGYGYERLGQELALNTPDVVLIVDKFIFEQKKLLKKCVQKPKKEGSGIKQDATQAWANRLSRLTGISIEESLAIAGEKIEYKNDCIYAMLERDNERGPSVRRSKLISKMERENPLRRIMGIEHAQAILAASHRHKNTDYEAKLEEGRELAAWGEIDRDSVKEYAREAITTQI